MLDLLFPQHCLGCGQKGGYFCADCLNLLKLKPERICPVCNQPALAGATHSFCQRPWGLDGLTSVFAYQGIMKKAIKKLKQRFVTDLATTLVELFLSFSGEDHYFGQLVSKEKPTLAPIPLHPARQRWRGFNQAELLGQLISQQLVLDFQPKLLQRTKKTKPQEGLSKKKRNLNLRSAFRLNPGCRLKAKKGKFILFDDFWSSGATLKEAAKTLKRKGAIKVWGLTLAR